MASFIAAFLAASLLQSPITIDNFKPGETVRYPVIALRGHAPGEEAVKISGGRVQNREVPVVAGEFRTLVELKPGANMLTLRRNRDSLKFRVDYRPPTTPLKVMAVWVRAQDDPELSYALSPAGSKPRVAEKFDVALKTIQSFYAEAMNDAGYGRKTFPLDLDRQGKVVVHVLTVPKTAAELRAMENNASWGYLYGLLSKQFPEDKTHWCALLGSTTYDPETRKASGHYALGGGSLGAFGSASMPYWPTSLADVPKTMLDTTPTDPAVKFDDSNGRKTVWANVSTGWGAMAHEMGHTFGLPHSNDPFSVMSRGFDFFNRHFVVIEAPSARRSEAYAFRPDERSRWDKYSAAKLNWNPYFQADGPTMSTSATPSIAVEGAELIVSAPAGIRVWGADRDDTTAWFEEFVAADRVPTEKRIPLEELDAKFRRPYRVTVVDTAGRQVTIDQR